MIYMYVQKKYYKKSPLFVLLQQKGLGFQKEIKYVFKKLYSKNILNGTKNN